MRLLERYRNWLESVAQVCGLSSRLAWALYALPLPGVPVLMAEFEPARS